MKRWFQRAVLVMGALMLAVAPAFAQGGGASSTGSISGQVVDDSGAVLPGVTVTATSPAQMGAPTAITNEEGIYRFPSVPPGEYKLTFELAGFSTLVREGIRVTVGFNAGVNVKLGVATLQETVTVSGESPVVDTTATRIQTNFDQQQLASLPNARDMWSLLAASPSITLNRVDVGGSTAGTQTTYFAYGYSGQNRPLIEGINTTEGTAAAGFYLDYGSFEEVFIGAAGNSAEMPNPGVLTQFVSKSGGNNFSVNVYYDYENEKIQSRNLAADQIQPNTAIRPDGNRLTGYYNLNLGVGGPIIRDKIWFFGAYLNQQNKVAAPPAGSFLDGTTFRTKLFNYTAKGTYQLSQNNKFIGYLQHGTKQQPNRTDNSNRLLVPVVHITADSSVLQDSPSWVYKGEWNGTFGQNAFVEVRAGQFGYNFGLVSNTQDFRYESIDTGQVIGGGRDWMNRRRRNQYTASVSFFKDNFAGGSHNLKVGGEYLDESGNIIWNEYYRDQVIHLVTGPLTGPLSATTPVGVRLHNPSSSKNGLKQISMFITDSWTIDRLTLNVGARFDRYTPWLPAQTVPVSRFNPVEAQIPENSSVLTFNHIVPRFGATYDLMGDGKTVLKGNWGRFYFNTGVNLADAVNPNTSNQYADYTWNDNGDRLYQPGEEGVVGQNFRYTGVASVALDAGLENAYTDEASVFVEREVMRDLGVRVGYVWKKDNNGWQQIVPNRPFAAYNVPVTVVDPGPDGLAATTADNGTLQLLNLDNPAGRPITQLVTNIDGYEGTYRTLEFSSNKRYSDRWSMNASFSYTWTEEFGNNYFNNRTGLTVNQFAFFGSYPTNPNERTHNEYTGWNAKLSGTVDAGWGLRVTPVLKSQSGAPYGRVVNVAGCSTTVVTNCLNYGAQPILVEPIGTRRQDTVTLLDFRVEKQIPIPQSRARLGLFFDLFNVTNSNTAVNLAWASGARFERATTVIPPRIAKFGVKFDW
jgi:hypothetical protein